MPEEEPPEDVPEGRIPPHDMVAEQSILGAMMLAASAVHAVTAIVQAGDFYVPKHGLIFGAITVLAERGEPVDAITVADELQKAGVLARAGGAAHLHELTGLVPTAANAAFYADIVREKAIRRRLVEAGIRITNMGYTTTGEAVEVAEDARGELEHAAQNARSDLRAIGKAFAEVVDDLSAAPSFVETPWREINDIIGGLRKGGLYVVGGRPGDGKTIVGLQLAQQLAYSGPVAFSSLEMSEGELLKRLIALKGKVHLGPISKHRLSDEDWQRVASVRGDIERMPLFVDDRSGVTITQIKAHARSAQRRGQLAGVVVDYLQLITGGARDRPRHEVVGEISRQLKVLARELECPVVALSQLNRESVGKQKRAPSLADLRESGTIEQDADVVLLLQRQMDEDDRPGDRLNVHIAKNRHGPANVMKTLLWEGQYARVMSQGWGFGGYALPVPD